MILNSNGLSWKINLFMDTSTALLVFEIKYTHRKKHLRFFELINFFCQQSTHYPFTIPLHLNVVDKWFCNKSATLHRNNDLCANYIFTENATCQVRENISGFILKW